MHPTLFLAFPDAATGTGSGWWTLAEQRRRNRGNRHEKSFGDRGPSACNACRDYGRRVGSSVTSVSASASIAGGLRRAGAVQQCRCSCRTTCATRAMRGPCHLRRLEGFAIPTVGAWTASWTHERARHMCGNRKSSRGDVKRQNSANACGR